MSDAIISAVAGRLIVILEEQIRSEVNLVRGVKKEVVKLSEELKRVRNVLDDADKRGFKDKSIKDWLKRLEDASYEMDDVLDEWNISLIKLQMKPQKVPFTPYSSCLSFKKLATHRYIALKIKNVKAQLDVILKEKNRYNFLENQGTDSFVKLERVTTSFVEIEEVKGRDVDRDNLVSKIISHNASFRQGDRPKSLYMTSILGAGGIGKTTLAQLIYNDSQVENFFPHRIWICVSDPFDEARIAREIVQRVGGSTRSTNELQVLLELLRESISGKKFLLILDDVWPHEDTKWRPLRSALKYGALGSRIVVTTRDKRVAEMMGTNIENEIHQVEQLSDEYCWSLLCGIAFSGRSDLEKSEGLQKIGRKIAKRCGGLPLAAKALGSLLRFKNTTEEWEDVLKSELWELENAKVGIFPHLLLSYNDLSLAQKRCFSYCAVFPKDYVLVVDDLIRKWMALGYLSTGGGNANELEVRGREYFDNLAMRSLFQDFEKDDVNEHVILRCKMHDIVHDFAQFLREGDLKSSNDSVGQTMLKEASSCKTCSPVLSFRIKEYRSSIFLDRESFSSLHVCDCLASVRALDYSLKKERIISKKIIEKLIHLRHLNLSYCYLHFPENVLEAICKLYNLQSLLLKKCWLEEIPSKIGNLVQLRHLDLSDNYMLRGLPESISHLHELRSLDVSRCQRLSELPKGIDGLINLKHLITHTLYKYPQGLAQLTSLYTLNEFYGGSDWSKLGLLKKLNQLSGSLKLNIKLADDMEDDDSVEQAREAELRKKMHIRDLTIKFWYINDHKGLDLDMIEALEPHPCLQQLRIEGCYNSMFPEWIVSPVRQLRKIHLTLCHWSSLPHLGKLPCLEELEMHGLYFFQFVGREFLGITSISSSSIGFPKLTELRFSWCTRWKEWEDITAEEEESSTIVSLMPCLKRLEIIACVNLKVLPHRLLRKVSSLEKLMIHWSTELQKSYQEGPLTKFTSHIPRVEFR